MEIRSEYRTHIRIIELDGRLEAFTVGAFREEIKVFLENDEHSFIVDLSKVEFMDSAGMSALVSLLKSARQADGEVVLVKPTNAAAYRILSLTRFDKVFSMTDSVEDAIEKF